MTRFTFCHFSNFFKISFELTFVKFDKGFFKDIINCSQTKFIAIIIVLSVFFYAIFRLTDFSSDALTFRPQKRDKQVAPSGH